MEFVCAFCEFTIILNLVKIWHEIVVFMISYMQNVNFSPNKGVNKIILRV